jgi:hypothetical protein
VFAKNKKKGDQKERVKKRRKNMKGVILWFVQLQVLNSEPQVCGACDSNVLIF